MEYYLTDCRNSITLLCEDCLPLLDLLNQNYEHWNYGSGDSCIRFFDNNCGIMFFKTKFGIFIYDLSTNTSPLKDINQQAKAITHYIGGEPFDVPDICLLNEKESFEILRYLVEDNGMQHPNYNWIDIYQYISFRYDADTKNNKSK